MTFTIVELEFAFYEYKFLSNKVQQGDIVLDPMCGSGTLNVEASIIGIDSIGIEKSPFCVLMSRVKYEALKSISEQLSRIES